LGFDLNRKIARQLALIRNPEKDSIRRLPTPRVNFQGYDKWSNLAAYVVRKSFRKTLIMRTSRKVFCLFKKLYKKNVPFKKLFLKELKCTVLSEFFPYTCTVLLGKIQMYRAVIEIVPCHN
jgi:hypothetical protein